VVFLLYATTMTNGKKRLTEIERREGERQQKKLSKDLCEEKTAWMIKIKVIEE
jgi:hypothetical protein